MKKFKNTVQKGSVRYIIFKEDDIWYGVALEFNVTVDGDNPVEVMASLFEAIEGYIETVKKMRLRPYPLNQMPDKEYQDMWEKLEKNREGQKPIPKNIYTFGYSPIKPCAMAY